MEEVQTQYLAVAVLHVPVAHARLTVKVLHTPTAVSAYHMALPVLVQLHAEQDTAFGARLEHPFRREVLSCQASLACQIWRCQLHYP